MSYLLNINTKLGDRKKSSNQISFANNLIVQDLDSFFKNIYDYYYCRGYSNIFTQTILDNITYLFSIHFFILNFFVIDWKKIINTCVDEEKCDLEISEFFSNRLLDEDFFSFIVIYSLLISYYLLFLWKSLLFLYKMKKVKFIFDHKLRIKQKEMENLNFDEIIHRLIELQKTENYCRIKQNLTKFDIISRILRKENFLIAMITNNILDLKIKIPLVGEKTFFSNYLYNILYDCILKFAFEKGETKLNEKIMNLALLRFKMIIYLITEIIFIPATIFFKIIFWLFRNADNLSSKGNNNNRNFSHKNWCFSSKILFRNYNELQHHFEYRLEKSYKSVEKFMNCFRDRRVGIISKFFLMITGSFFILIFIISTIDNRLLTDLKIFNRKIVWIAFVIGVLISIFSSGSIYNKNSDEDYLENKEFKERNYKEIVNKVMNIPCDWRKSQNFSSLYKKISESYELALVSLCKEIISILIFPYFWIKIILTRTKNIVQFFKFYAKDVNGVGVIYSYSYFDISNFKFFKERDFNFSELTFNDRKFLNSFIDYDDKFHSVYELELEYDEESEEEIMKKQCRIIEERLHEIYKKENENFNWNTSLTKVTSYKRSLADSGNSGDSNYMFKSLIHYHISQLNINEIMLNEKENVDGNETLIINDSI